MPEAPMPAPVPRSVPVPLRLDCHRINLDSPLPEGTQGWLSGDEQARAERFRFAHLRHRYRASRVALRALLAERLDIAPGDVRFITSAQGKPALHPDHAGGLHFNLSHSEAGGWLVLADQPVGIDVENIDRPMPERAALLPRIATAAEQQQMHRLPDHYQGAAFFLAWTRKEALLKAWGDGIRGFGSLSRLDTRLPDPIEAEAFFDSARSCAGPPASIGMTSLPMATLPLRQIPHPGHRPDAIDNRQPLWLQSFACGHEIISVAAPMVFSVSLQPCPLLPPGPPDRGLPASPAASSHTEMP
ncbi:MAG: 4'-phosphopantetheinyl transferase superfamily protein [Lautropia sp.]|nr:4'-phosphopantetheinyl transferase superfamily protein [Lautropia sp.]